jgi:blue copper oxidase
MKLSFRLFIFLVVLFTFNILNAQFTEKLFIPPTITGDVINLEIKNSTKQIFNGYETNTIGYNGNYLGPTIILQKEQNVTMNVKNSLGDTTTTHWHGLHVAPENDGGPHTFIYDGDTWSPSFKVMDIAATYWYHPHLHMKTMTQVMKGAAGLIIVQDSNENSLKLPREYAVDDIPLILNFTTIDNITKQFVMKDELDNTVLINGVNQPLQEVPAQIVRFRILNASSHRFFQFGLDDNRNFYQIASDAGLLDLPVKLTRVILGPGERAEILVDFTNQVGKEFYLKQFGTELPQGYPGGPLMRMGMGGGTMGELGPLDEKDFNIMKFKVIAPTNNAITEIPKSLNNNIILSQTGASIRNIEFSASPMNSMTNFFINGVQYKDDVINFSSTLGKTEIWNITNRTMMPHPFHVHGNSFYVLSVNGSIPPLNMTGRKDVVVVPPRMGNVRIITKYEDFTNDKIPFMYHCHILSHEDGGMMGQFLIQNPMGIEYKENLDLNELMLFPNPTNNEINFKSIKNIDNNDDNINNIIDFVEIKNTLGETMIIKRDNLENKTIDVSSLVNGIYFIIIKTNNNILHQKFIKK